MPSPRLDAGMRCDLSWQMRPAQPSPMPRGICLDVAEATGPAVADVTAALLGSLLDPSHKELSRTSLAFWPSCHWDV